MTATLRCSLDEASDVATRRHPIRELYEAAEETLELDDGYAFRPPGDEAHTLGVFEFVAFERTCCPFRERGRAW